MISYVDLSRFKGTAGLNLNIDGAGTSMDVVLRSVGEAVSQAIDAYCDRTFMVTVAEQRFFDGNGTGYLRVNDYVSLAEIAEDDRQDGTFGVTWGANDYANWPYNANPTSLQGSPYRVIYVSSKSNGTQDHFQRGQRNYRVTGTWGYSRATSSSGLTGTIGSATSTITLTLSAAIGTVIAVGQSLAVGTEIMYVKEAPSSTATTVTVVRAQQNSSATAHTAVGVNVFVYPGPVTEAAFIQAARLWRRKDSAFASQAGLLETGQLVVFQGGLDQDVKMLLSPYRRRAV